MDLVTVGRVDERCWVRDGRWGHFQMDLDESCLLMRTSRRRSLALILLYSLYSSSIGTRSSFCTFLRGERSLENQQRPIKVRCLCTIKGWSHDEPTKNKSPGHRKLSPTFRYADKSLPQTPGWSSSVSSSLLWFSRAVPAALAWRIKTVQL